MHDGGDTELRRRLEHGVADIAAGADGDVRLKVLDDLARVLRRLPRVVQRAEVVFLPGERYTECYLTES